MEEMNVTREISNKDAIRILRIVADCKESNLPYLMDAIGRFGFNDDAISEAASLPVSLDKRSQLAEIRAAQDKTRWKATGDPVVLKLRKLYDNGVSLTKLGKYCAIDKSSMYRYMWGEKRVTGFVRTRLENGMDDYLFDYPIDGLED